jgi:hypothetical protein
MGVRLLSQRISITLSCRDQDRVLSLNGSIFQGRKDILLFQKRIWNQAKRPTLAPCAADLHGAPKMVR